MLNGIQDTTTFIENLNIDLDFQDETTGLQQHTNTLEVIKVIKYFVKIVYMSTNYS